MGSDVKALTGVKGLGKKGAERIVLELKDKLKNLGSASDGLSLAAASGDGAVASPAAGSLAADAVEALMVLGYKQADAANAVSSVYEEGIDLQSLIRASLKTLAR
jgi:Holliday junction DNA helicase RuvA